MSSATPSSPDCRPLRRDAEENRLRILRSAREVFAERGVEVSLDDIARHAGVGVGTVYRRFSGKRELIETLLREQVEDLAAVEARSLACEDPWEGFVHYVMGISELFVRDRGLREVTLMGTFGDITASARDRFLPTISRMMERAQESGRMRPDVTPTDLPVIGLMLGTAGEYAHALRPDLWRRYLLIILDGLRSPVPSPLPEPLSGQEVDRLIHAARHRKG
ncbi:TetR/AcrR family transcriptional regulator [Marinactinospora thermotolerans]|uniref:Transcriptional regulator, TetR family n=1 Tax=Marinactinospora thermotolerans DSM 45154 TaxID=1122192 RepID=A0A1T4PQP1_9ACTN|nr:TetR/AcrR family transcriptional regulator [Marinactinospora thermotolerans]SJZ93547.1 transcriptional regulator, TetR family [Marinactinospora thermotolerans DSM 45154]